MNQLVDAVSRELRDHPQSSALLALVLGAVVGQNPGLLAEVRRILMTAVPPRPSATCVCGGTPRMGLP